MGEEDQEKDRLESCDVSAANRGRETYDCTMQRERGDDEGRMFVCVCVHEVRWEEGICCVCCSASLTLPFTQD